MTSKNSYSEEFKHDSVNLRNKYGVTTATKSISHLIARPSQRDKMKK